MWRKRNIAGQDLRIDMAPFAHMAQAEPVVMRVTPVRPAHPVRTKDDGERQVSWLTGHGLMRRLLRMYPNGMWHMALRLQLQGQPGIFAPFPFHPRCRGTCRCGADMRGSVPRQCLAGVVTRQ